MRTLGRLLAATGFLASAALHLLTFTPWGARVGERAVWALGALAFLLALAMVVWLRRAPGTGRGRVGRLAVVDWRALVRLVPPGLRFLIVGAALYAWMNFALCLLLDVPPAEHILITIRMATGHLLFFFLVPLVFFRFVAPGLEAAHVDEEAARP